MRLYMSESGVTQPVRHRPESDPDALALFRRYGAHLVACRSKTDPGTACDCGFSDARIRLDAWERAAPPDALRRMSKTDVGHGQRTTRYWDPNLGVCVCLHCDKLPLSLPAPAKGSDELSKEATQAAFEAYANADGESRLIAAIRAYLAVASVPAPTRSEPGEEAMTDEYHAAVLRQISKSVAPRPRGEPGEEGR
jgi:hypothetical protein